MHSEETPTVFYLHFLGGSAREWESVARRLEGHLRLVALDLPGFGDAAQTRGYTVAEMVALDHSKSVIALNDPEAHGRLFVR